MGAHIFTIIHVSHGNDLYPNAAWGFPPPTTTDMAVFPIVSGGLFNVLCTCMLFYMWNFVVSKN